MERYESLGLVGEGSYGTVLKCRHRDSGRLVAIKKFMDSDDDKTVKKIALREIKLLRQLRHDNLVNLIEVWKRRRRWYLVFEFVERTLLDDLEQNPNGLELNTSRQFLYQILRAAAFCHQQNVIHRDIKPENILISQGGVVKLCDFGFARTMTSPAEGGIYTDYVATRWYRAPELLVGDTKYGKPVDVWAVGCLLIEMLTGQPLFPGDSDLDQIYHIVRCFGNLTAHHQELFYRNPVFSGVRLPECSSRVPLEQRFSTVTPPALDLAQSCLQMDPERRAQCSDLLEHLLFTQDSFHIRVLDELNAKIQKDHRENSTLPKIAKTPRREKDDGDDKTRRGKDKDKKQSENVDEKVNKEKEGGEEKVPKTKTKQPSKLPKSILNKSEPLMSTKQSKTLDAKITENTAKSSVAMRSKAAKATGAELRKEPEISKPTKSLTSDSLEAPKTATDLKDSKTVVAKPRHGKVGSPDPRKDHLKNMDTKDRDSTGLPSSCSNNKMSSVSQDSGKSKNSNTKVPKLSKSSTTDHPNDSSAKSTTHPTDTNLTKTAGKIYPEGPTTAKTDRSDMDTEQRRTSECPQVLPPNPKSAATTSNSGPKYTKNKSSLSTSPSKTLTSDLSTQSSIVFVDVSPTHSTTMLSKGTLKTGSSSDTKPTNSVTSIPNKPSRGLPTDRELTEVIKYQPDGSNTSNKEDHGSWTKTAANHIEISSGGDHKENPESSEHCGIDQQSTESSSSISVLSEIPKTNTSVGTTVLKSLKVSDKENRQDLAFSEFISTTSKSLVNPSSKVSRSSNIEQNNSSDEAGLNIKSLKSSHSKSLIGEPFSKSTTAMTQKTRFLTDVRKKRDNPENNDTTNVNITADSASFTTSATPDHKTLTRSSVFHHMDTSDTNEFEVSLLYSSPPPPPPPPSSTPLLLPPSSTSVIPSFSVISNNSPVSSDHFTLAAGFHPGTHSLRCVDKPRHHGGVYTRPSLSSHITGPLAAQVSDKSLTCERSFLSDRYHHGNSGGVTVKKKSDVHFPDLRSSLLPELRGRESKHKGTTKNQRKDKQPVLSVTPTEPQQPGYDRTDSYSP